MQTSVAMMQESIWFDRLKFEQDLEHYQMFVHNNLPVLSEAGDSAAKPELFEQKKPEAKKNEKIAQPKVEETKQDSTETSTLSSEIEKARRAIESTLSGLSTSVSDHLTSSDGRDVSSRVDALESENRALRELLSKLTIRVESLEARLVKAEGGAAPCKAAPEEEAKKETKDEDDDDFDMFGDDEEDEEEETEEEKKIREEKLATYHAKKAGKTAVIAKSSLTLNVKPWDDETDMKKMEESVRTISMDGLVWGGAKLVPVAFGIKMLQILCVVEDAKVSTDDLQERIAEFDEFIQSSDIAAFNKI